MNTTPPPARDLPPHRHAHIRATLLHTANTPRPPKWMAPTLSMATAIIALGLVMWFIPPDNGDGSAARPATTSTTPTPTQTQTADDSTVRLVRIPPDDIPELVHGCVHSAGDSAEADGNFTLKFAFTDAAGPLAVLYSDNTMIACGFDNPTGEYTPTFAVLDTFQPPITADLNFLSPITGTTTGQQLVIGRIDPTTTTRVTLTQNNLTTDAILVGDVYAARIIRPLDWWLTNNNPPTPVVHAYNTHGDLVGSASPHY